MHFGNKKLLLTGATGLIGKDLLAPLIKNGFEVYGLTIDTPTKQDGIYWIPCNIFDFAQVQKICKDIKATYLLNMAWATTGDYLSSPINYEFLTAGVNLLKAFSVNGGKRVVFAGTCFEYQFQTTPLKETDTLDPTKTTYSFCKDTLHNIADYYCKQNNISFAYGRIFYVYGRNENKLRLTGMLVDKLSNNQEIIIKSGSLLRDYMYTKDIANSFVALLDSNVLGSVNICTGKAISIKDFALSFARKVGKEHLICFRDEVSNQPNIIVGDNTRLIQEVGYKIQYNFDNAIQEILNSDYVHK